MVVAVGSLLAIRQESTSKLQLPNRERQLVYRSLAWECAEILGHALLR
jgi:hypothetical protein